ncbi:MAG: hypothetical protein M3Q07_15165 [Pseudobdellovibrionaceae bacterium]|nr:hypothetical protein [Pseudobdellovibrionaceae bacterium]
MHKFNAAILKPLVFAAFSAGILGACTTTAPTTSGKVTCVEQEAKTGSRMPRRTCKTEDVQSTPAADPTVSAR